MHPGLQQRQTLLQQRLDNLRQQGLFLQEMFQSYHDLCQLSVPQEERRACFLSLQNESLRHRQALQQYRQDLQQERQRWRGEK